MSTDNKRYRLRKEIISSNPISERVCEIGTVSEYNRPYYIFPYSKTKGNTSQYGPEGQSFMCSNPELYPEWFEEEHKCKHCGAWTSQPDSQCYKAPTNPIPDTPEKFQKRWNRIQTEIFEEKVAKDTPVKERIEIFSHQIADGVLVYYNPRLIEKAPAIKQAIEAALNEDTVVGLSDEEIKELARRYYGNLKIGALFGENAKEINADIERRVFDFYVGYKTANGEKIPNKVFQPLNYLNPTPEKTDTVVQDKGIQDEYDGERMYLQSEVDTMMEEAFWAARANAENHSGIIRFHSGEGMYHYNKKFTTFNDYKNSLPPKN